MHQVQSYGKKEEEVPKVKELTIEEVVKHVYTTENPETGSKPNPNLAWVIFENGTVFLTAENDEIDSKLTIDQIKEYAAYELYKAGEPVGGTSSADFTVDKLPWYPKDNIYIVSYEYHGLFNIMILEEDSSHLSIGLQARSQRAADFDKQLVRTVRHFNGKTYDVKGYRESLIKDCYELSIKYAPPKINMRDAKILDYYGDDSYCTHIVNHKNPDDVTLKDHLKYGLDCWAFMDGKSLLFYFYTIIKNKLKEIVVEDEFFFYSLNRKLIDMDQVDIDIIQEILWNVDKEHWCCDENSTPYLHKLVMEYEEDNKGKFILEKFLVS